MEATELPTRSYPNYDSTASNAGPTVKIILGALLVLICASMAITLIRASVQRRSRWASRGRPGHDRRSDRDRARSPARGAQHDPPAVSQRATAGQHAASIFRQSGGRAAHHEKALVPRRNTLASASTTRNFARNSSTGNRRHLFPEGKSSPGSLRRHDPAADMNRPSV